jgi:hypothetical protein
MIYLASLSMSFFLLLIVVSCGRRIASFLPEPLCKSAAFYVAPLLGMAALVLIATVYGWLSPFKTGISVVLSVALLCVCIFFEREPLRLVRQWLIVSAFAAVVSLPILAPLIRFDAYNPLNDTFTYLVHGQWLQNHAFSEPARGSGFYPGETQVLLYQGAGLRMGGSFLLGYVQSLFRQEWSYYAYPAAVSLPFTVGALAIGGIIRQVLVVSEWECLSVCTLPAFTLNGFVFGAQYGFFPQTFGLAFSIGTACLLPGVFANIVRSTSPLRTQFLWLLPLSICCAALLISYNEIVPLFLAGGAIFLVTIFWWHWAEKARIAGAVLLLLLQISLVVNIEGFRIVRNFFGIVIGAASGAVHFGWPMYWYPSQFVGHSFGLKAPFQNGVFTIDRILSIWVFPILLITIVWSIIRIFRSRPGDMTILFLLSMNVVIWLAFIRFRYFTDGLEGEIGNTFLQFKLSKWASAFNLAILGIVGLWLFSKLDRFRQPVIGAFAVLVCSGIAFQSVAIAGSFTAQVRNETMRSRSSFDEFLELRAAVAEIPNDQIIYLDFGAERHKLRQLVIYVLFDRKLASRYEDDGYLAGSIPVPERNMPVTLASWMIRIDRVRRSEEDPLHRVGPMVVLRAPFSFFALESVAGAYATESDDRNSWNWVKDSAIYRFHSVGATAQSRAKFQFVGKGAMVLEITTSSGRSLGNFEIPMQGEWGTFESPTLDSASEDLVLEFRSRGTPARLSENDARIASFMIQNIEVQSAGPGS